MVIQSLWSKHLRFFVTAHGGSNLANGFAIIKTAHNRTQIKPQTLGSSSCTALTISLSQMKAVISVARSSIHCCGGHPSTVSLMAYLSSKRIFSTLDLQIEGAKADTKFSGKACKKDKIRRFTASSSDPSTFVDCQAYQSVDHQRQCCSAQSFWTLWTAWMVQWPVQSSTHVGSVSSAVRSFKTEVSNVNPMCCPINWPTSKDRTRKRHQIHKNHVARCLNDVVLEKSHSLLGVYVCVCVCIIYIYIYTFSCLCVRSIHVIYTEWKLAPPCNSPKPYLNQIRWWNLTSFTTLTGSRGGSRIPLGSSQAKLGRRCSHRMTPSPSLWTTRTRCGFGG